RCTHRGGGGGRSVGTARSLELARAVGLVNVLEGVVAVGVREGVRGVRVALVVAEDADLGVVALSGADDEGAAGDRRDEVRRRTGVVVPAVAGAARKGAEVAAGGRLGHLVEGAGD